METPGSADAHIRIRRTPGAVRNVPPADGTGEGRWSRGPGPSARADAAPPPRGTSPADLPGPRRAADPTAFEDEFRHALRATAQSGRALGINTRLPLHATVLRWWHEEGSDAVTFGSDAHLPAAVAHGFADAVRMAEAHGFRPGRSPIDLWTR